MKPSKTAGEQSPAAAQQPKASEIYSLSGDGKAIIDRQNRVLLGTNLSLIVGDVSRWHPPLTLFRVEDWWRSVSAQGSLLVFQSQHVSYAETEFRDISKASGHLKDLIANLLNRHPKLHEPKLSAMIADLEHLREQTDFWAKLYPKKAQSRPKIDNMRRSIDGLAHNFREGFGVADTLTRDGPFERFVSAVILEIGGVARTPGWMIETMRVWRKSGGGK